MATDVKKGLPLIAAANLPGEMREQGAPNVDCDALFLNLRRSRRRQKQSADFGSGPEPPRTHSADLSWDERRAHRFFGAGADACPFGGGW